MADLTNKQLQAQTQALAKQAARDGQQIGMIGAQIADHAQDTRRIVTMIGAMKVDPDTVSETRQLAKLMDGLSEASLAYCSTAAQTTKTADQAAHVTRTTHDGIDEAVNRSPARNIHDVRREWLTQE